MTSNLVAPQSPPRWDHTPEEIVALTKEAIQRKKDISDAIGTLPEHECTFESVFLPLADAEGEFGAVTECTMFYANVSADDAIRDASTQAANLTNDFRVEDSMHIGAFRAEVNAEKDIRTSGRWDSLTMEERRLVERMVLDGKRAGLGLPEEEQEKLAALQKKLAAVCVEHRKNLNEENGAISFTVEELDGIPQDIIAGYTKREEGGKEVYISTLDSTDIMPVVKQAHNPDVRKRASEAREGRLPINVPLFDRAIELRKQIASLLGYDCWADYITEIKMAKTGKNAADFLDDLAVKLRPIGERERDALLALKKEDCEGRGLTFDGQLNVWDEDYYTRVLTKKSLQFDASPLKEYFPVAFIVPKIIEIYQSLLGVRFVEVNSSKKNVWHPDVRQFEIWEADAVDEMGFVGHCYMDLYPRPNKYENASAWPLIAGRAASDKSARVYPVSAIVANLAKPTPEQPALAPHSEVVSFFHEMGHLFHCQLSRVRFSRFSGVEVARDFEEAPSQMLENWCWEPKVLEKMTSHYVTQQPLPADLIGKLVESRYVNVGLFYLRQAFIMKYDMKVHIDKELRDSTALWNELREQIALVKSGNPQPGHVGYNHMLGGYDAGIYGYLYSLVFAMDMYTVFKDDPLSPALGQRYRREILEVGGSRDEIDSVTRFIGRPPNAEAFTRVLFGDNTMAG